MKRTAQISLGDLLVRFVFPAFVIGFILALIIVNLGEK